MRRQAIIFILFRTILVSIGQDVKVEKTTEEKLLISPFTVHGVKEFTDSSYIAIKLIETRSAIAKHPDNPYQEVVLSDFLLLVKERFDDKDLPDKSANFWVKGNFYNPRNFMFRKSDRLLTFQHGTDRNIKTTTLFVSTGEIKVK